jgi:hypothetical protein
MNQIYYWWPEAVAAAEIVRPQLSLVDQEAALKEAQVQLQAEVLVQFLLHQVALRPQAAQLDILQVQVDLDTAVQLEYMQVAAEEATTEELAEAMAEAAVVPDM